MQDYSQNNNQQNDSDNNQDLYDIFVAQGIKIAASVADMLNEQPQDGIIGTVGDAMVDIVHKIEDDGAKNGFQFSEAIKFHGAQNILDNLLRMSGIKLNENETKTVIGHMVGRYLDESVKAGKMTKEQVVQMARDANQQQQAGEQNGIRGTIRGDSGGQPSSQ